MTVDILRPSDIAALCSGVSVLPLGRAIVVNLSFGEEMATGWNNHPVRGPQYAIKASPVIGCLASLGPVELAENPCATVPGD